MESDRVEMSVGSGMVNGDHNTNGTASNGTSTITKSQPQPAASSAGQTGKSSIVSYTNGDVVTARKDIDTTSHGPDSILQDAPEELLQALSSEFYLPMARLVHRSAQSCWNDLSSLVERLATMPLPNQAAPNPGAATINDQSKTNLEKKDLLLNFAKDHKDKFIKLLVLLQWSKKSEDVRKTIELNHWVRQQRQAFNDATGMLGAMMRGLADAQVPNPDLHTAAEVLATGRVASMPTLNYIPQPPLTAKQMLRVLRRLDTILCTRMALAESLPDQLREYHIHDGRLSFTVEHEFTFDVSVMSEDLTANFGMVDFDFVFTPKPSIPDGLHGEVIFLANAAIEKDGFTGVYDFLHDLTLSYKLSEYAQQARTLSQGLWAGRLKVEVLRRTLVVQYWLRGSGPKSWIEIGIQRGSKADAMHEQKNVPGLHLRWIREGKVADVHDIELHPSQLSIETILRQAIAQHTNRLFDDIYDKLVLSPPYSDARLALNQTASSEDPADSTLDIQLSKADVLSVTMEPIGGTLVLSPVSERTSRMQSDLARSANIVDDFVSRLTRLRSNTAEYNLVRALPDSQWQRLEGVKLSLSEAEILFGKAVTRVSFLRLPHWAQQWMLTVTQAPSGDQWWLTQIVQANTVTGSRVTEIVENHPLYSVGSPPPAYLERLADYVTGAIALQCNAELLSTKILPWILRDIPAFDENTRLPALQFSRASIGSPKASSIRQTNPSSFVHLSYHGTAKASKRVIMIAKAALTADSAVLKDLASSKLDQSVVIIPDKRQVMVKMESEAGVPVIEEIMSKLSRLESIVACAASVNKSTEHTLQSLSLQTMTILYHAKPDLSLVISFGNDVGGLSAEFLPADANPQRHLSSWVAQCMKRGQNASINLSNVFVVLRMTRPLMSYLQSIQLRGDVQGTETPASHPQLRVHTIYRSPTAYGIHYFASSSNFTRDESHQETPKKLLARFEILAMKRGDRLMWMVRPAIEEFNSYHRPSYTSNDLREKLIQEVFKKPSSLWLALDGGAACPSDKPEKLMSAIHETISNWAKEAVKPEATSEAAGGMANGMVVDNSNDKKAARPNTAQNQKTPAVQQRANAGHRPHQQTNQQRLQNFNNNRNTGSRPAEAITIE